MEHKQITDDLASLLEVLPFEITEALGEIDRNSDLIEVILDLGRVPTARYTDGEVVLLNREVTQDDLDLAVMQVGDFDADNRAGIDGTLHRISGIRNRRGDVVGLTCRVGRAVFGTIDIIQDIIESGESILFLGRPGVGKTTMLREAARVLADSRRVVIVDTSNEIGGDGDIPHPAVGRARRMQVPTPSLQHEVMIEAVENHNPEVIVIDEIGRELEAAAARTIAERGVQLIGTAHGVTLENLLLNPTLSDLVGGIESVTLSDEEARRRGTQKTVLERRAPATFDVLVELQDRNTLATHHDVGQSVDALLRGLALQPELRHRSDDGQIVIEKGHTPVVEQRNGAYNGGASPRGGNGRSKSAKRSARQKEPAAAAAEPAPPASTRRVKVFPYGIARNRLIESARDYRVSLDVVDDLEEADVLLTLKNFYRRRPRVITDAERMSLPIYVLRSNTVAQIEDFMVDFFEIERQGEGSERKSAIHEAKAAIEAVLSGAPMVDLSPQSSEMRRRQHEMIREANLNSHSYGKEPRRHIRVYRD